MNSNKNFTALLEKARDDLQEYVDRKQEEGEEVDPEVPVYFAELESCQTENEIYEYMEEFGWEEREKYFWREPIVELFDKFVLDEIYQETCEEYYEKVKNAAIRGNIYLHCVYTKENFVRDKLKGLGYRWDPKAKLWYIDEKKLTKKIFEDSHVVRFINKTTIGRVYYFYTSFPAKVNL